MPPDGGDAESVCVFMIDRTGSMSAWVAAVRAVLPSLVHSVALTNVFDRIAIFTYADYDMAPDRVVTASGYKRTADAAEVRELEAFAKAIPCEGGGGAPEAFKTGLLALAAAAPPRPVKRMHVVHLTDAPPHCLPTLDGEGAKERSHLGPRFAWATVVAELRAAHPTLRYSALVTNTHPLYCHLAHVTQGDVHSLVGGASASNIRKQLGMLMNGWLGLPDGLQMRVGLLPCEVAGDDEAAIGALRPQQVDGAAAKCAVVSGALLSAVKRMKVDGPFREHVIAELQAILALDVMALTVSPIVGKLWRELCKARADPRRDQLIEVMNGEKAKLAAADRAVVEEWLKDSYNAKAEIDEQLVAFMRTSETRGLLRFVPENDELCAQQVVQLLARGDAKSTATIRAILSRMYVDAEARVPVLDATAASLARAPACTEVRTAAVAPIPKELAAALPHFRAALVVLPPAAVAEAADVFRQQHDQAFARWMPHMTLLFPFMAPEHFSACIAAIEAGVAATGSAFPTPFRMCLDTVTWFPGKKSVLHLAPRDVGGCMARLHEALLAMFPHLKRADRDEFHAHLTLGQCAGQEAPQIGARIQSEWPTRCKAPFEVREFHLIAHLDGEERYKVVHTFALPPAALAAKHVDPLAVRSDGADDENDDVAAEPPLPAATLPLNLPLERFWELAMHTVAPGTRLTRRYAALLAVHALQCGSVLADLARRYLEQVRGRWINWQRRDDDALTPEVPENFGAGFLLLVTDPAVAPLALTDDELAQAAFMLRVRRALRFFHGLELPVKLLDHCSADATLPDHDFLCAQCGKRRPLCIIADDGVCGYCKRGAGPATAEMDAAAQLQVRCHTCGSFYARDATVRIPGKSKCHGCQKLGAPSPAVECGVCHVRVVQFYKPENGLPKGGRCGPCAHGCPPRRLGVREFIGLAHNVFGGDGAFTLLCKMVGLELVMLATADGDVRARTKVVKFSSATSLIEAVLGVVPCAADPAIAVPDAGVEFREARPDNAVELWRFVADVMGGKAEPVRVECAVCLEAPKPGQHLVAACGRRGCQQRVCVDCARAWYGANQPGALLYPRCTLCQFCARTPAPHVVRGVAPLLLGLAQRIRTEPLHQDAYYAWCQACFRARLVATRDCVAAGDERLPDVHNFVCPDCIAARTAAAEGGNAGEAAPVIKACPKCTTATQKISGCNHMSCPCGAHWCWECAAFHSDDSGACYEHMATAHGRIFDFEAPQVPGDDEEYA